ncbi:hypothetical protein AWZ03_004462 [Drosophila navojoa]|uniref:Uncharacterized protein n=1 Tax=Drosophila navojoa TaxID=7232 RepID=A0A484BLT0_DRONA|nr:uncharacterized protein LOC108653584 isoform X1 [Drosophila navojoa]XP_030238932.1 uncharacterized protein LOC108653584 isoform X2 [Drosophila navojoa]TDG49162.1 hypothetical protein AWZ03_004462 [Drosophila navojoa]
MEFLFASELYNESDSEQPVESEENSDEENMVHIDNTIKNISRNLRKGDWTYLGRHPEIRAIIRVIIMQAVKQKPSDIFAFAADLFSIKKQKQLIKLINKQLKWVNKLIHKGNWSAVDGAMLFSESSDCHMKKECSGMDQPLETIFEVKNMCPENFKPSC